MNILIDFDGTCVTHNHPTIGEEIGAVPVLKALVAKGHNLILFTMRGSGKISLEKFGRGRSHMWMRKLTRQEHQHYMYLLYDFFDGAGYNYDSGVTEVNDRIEKEYILIRDSMNLFYRVQSPFLIESVPEPIRMIPNKNRRKFF